MKSYKISEILYWIIAVVALYETLNIWNSNREKAFIFIIFGLLSIFMALFRRHYRKKFKQREDPYK